MRDIRAALRAHPVVHLIVWVGLVFLVIIGALHVYSLYSVGSGGQAARGTISLGHLHWPGAGKLHSMVRRNDAGGAPFARSQQPAVQDIAGPQGSAKDESFTGVVTPAPPASWPVMPYPADYAAVDD